MTCRQFECVLALQCIGRVITLQQIARVVEQHADIGTTFHIGNFQQ